MRQMTRSQLNLKPIKCSHSKACVLLGNVLREYMKNETREEMIKRYERFRKQERKNGSGTKECIQDITEGTGESWRRSCTSDTNTTISTAA